MMPYPLHSSSSCTAPERWATAHFSSRASGGLQRRHISGWGAVRSRLASGCYPAVVTTAAGSGGVWEGWVAALVLFCRPLCCSQAYLAASRVHNFVHVHIVDASPEHVHILSRLLRQRRHLVTLEYALGLGARRGRGAAFGHSLHWAAAAAGERRWGVAG